MGVLALISWGLFSAPEPKAQVHFCDHVLSVVRRLSSLTFHIFDFSSKTTEQNSMKLDRKQDLWTELNETWQEARSQRPLPSLCFSGQSEKQDGHPGIWLAETFSTSPMKPLNRIQWNLIGSKMSTSSTKFVFFGRIRKTRWPPWPLIGWEFSTSPLKPLNGIQRNMKGSKMSSSSTKFVFLGPIGKTRWPPWPLIGWDIFDFSSETAEKNSKNRKQDLYVLYQVCVFRADWKNKMAALASDWLIHFYAPLRKQEGHIVLHMSVGMSIGRYVGIP